MYGMCCVFGLCVLWTLLRDLFPSKRLEAETKLDRTSAWLHQCILTSLPTRSTLLFSFGPGLTASGHSIKIEALNITGFHLFGFVMVINSTFPPRELHWICHIAYEISCVNVIFWQIVIIFHQEGDTEVWKSIFTEMGEEDCGIKHTHVYEIITGADFWHSILFRLVSERKVSCLVVPAAHLLNPQSL